MDIDKLRCMAETVGATHDEMVSAQLKTRDTANNLFNIIIEECGIQEAPKFYFKASAFRSSMIAHLKAMRGKASKNHETIDAVITILSSYKW